ncbi:MAG: stage V sporulation protein AC [Clostridiales bacterium]|jgi:stage V sporulation protein AC|nr:stage V sporulation protein AC [Clostridiales bacterium]
MDVKQEKIKKEYQIYVQRKMPTSNLLRDCIMAFLVGGFICTIGQFINNLGKGFFGFNTEEASAFTSITMIFLGALLTGLGVYDDIGKYGGAGSVVPITGFANSIVSPAMEFKREGYVFGVGAKLFSIAGPVLIYGISASVLVGLIYLFIK